MANYEIKSRFGPIEAIKWKMFQGPTVSLVWPDVAGFVVNDTSPYWRDLGGAMNVIVRSDSPNLHYREYLEKNIGEQGIDWMWKHEIGCRAFISPGYHRQTDRLKIKLPKRNAKWASVLYLRWGQK
jgi:hypothetical protein